MKTPVYLSLFGSVFVALSGSWACGQGTLIIGHFGSADPTAEGFTLLRGGTPSLSPVMESGLDAWAINLDADDIGAYVQYLTPQQGAGIAGSWILSVNVRIREPFILPNNGIFADLNTDAEYFALRFGAEANGDPMVQFHNLSYTLNGGGSGYHNYQLRYDAVASLASLWIDGTERLSGLSGSPSPTSPFFRWGGGQRSAGAVSANWNEASLSAIPEPSSLLLLSLGGLALAAARARMRAKC